MTLVSYLECPQYFSRFFNKRVGGGQELFGLG